MDPLATLTIRETVLESILAAAREAENRECMGLLGTDMDCNGVISGACLLPARASASHAEAEPMAIRQAADLFRARRQQPVGLWHSHGAHGVFLSTVDDQTALQLLPAMADWNFRRAAHVVTAPSVTDQDSAALPLVDGRLMRLTLVGKAIPGLDGAHERVRWAHIGVSYTSPKRKPLMNYDGTTLRLASGGVCVTLRLPDEGTIITAIEDHAAVRTAHLFSLVVNRRGERYAEVVTVRDFAGESYVVKQMCEICIVEDPRPSMTPTETTIDLVDVAVSDLVNLPLRRDGSRHEEAIS